jgi:hypothetical protein
MVGAEKTGNIKMDPDSIGNVPIRVRDGVTGEYLYHIRKLDWINAKYPGTENYRNIVEYIPDGEGGFIDNRAAQIEELMKNRAAIVEKYNRDRSPSHGKIRSDGKGTGRLILNTEVEKGSGTSMKSTVVPAFATDMLPDPSLTLVIAGEKGVLMSGARYQFPGNLGFDPKDISKGLVGAMVPAANGQFQGPQRIHHAVLYSPAKVPG